MILTIAIVFAWSALMAFGWWHYHSMGMRSALALLRPELEEIREILKASSDSGDAHMRIKVLFVLTLLDELLGRPRGS